VVRTQALYRPANCSRFLQFLRKRPLLLAPDLSPLPASLQRQAPNLIQGLCVMLNGTVTSTL